MKYEYLQVYSVFLDCKPTVYFFIGLWDISNNLKGLYARICSNFHVLITFIDHTWAVYNAAWKLRLSPLLSVVYTSVWMIFWSSSMLPHCEVLCEGRVSDLPQWSKRCDLTRVPQCLVSAPPSGWQMESANVKVPWSPFKGLTKDTWNFWLVF